MDANHARGLMAGLVVLGAAACSYSEGNLRPDAGMKEASIEGITFGLVFFKKDAPQDLTPRAGRAYPGLFSPALSSIPVHAFVRCSVEDDETSLSCESRLRIFDRTGRFVESEPHPFRFVNTGDGAHVYEPFLKDTIPDHLVEAARVFVQKLDPLLLKDIHAFRKGRVSDVMIGGDRLWVLLGFERSSGESPGFDRASAIFHGSAEDAGSPKESAEIARLVNGVWVPRKAWIRLAARPTSVTVRLSDGVPAAVEVREEKSPPVTTFLSLGAPEDPKEVRWSNHMIVEAKNATLGETLKGMTLAELTALQTQMERDLLGLSEKAGQLELRLQQKMVKNLPTEPEMELVPLYKQRISIFEALVATMKQASRFK